MDRITLKRNAKIALREAKTNPYVCSLILLIVTFIFSLFSMGNEVMSILAERGMETDRLILTAVSTYTMVITLVSSIVMSVMQVGYNSFCLKISRYEGTESYSDLFAYFRYILKIIGLSFVMNVFITLWTLLFIIPGFVASLRYSQAYFVLAEDPSKGIMQCIRESKEMMAGHKMDCFILQLSFIGWALLAAFTCMLGYVYVQPYMTVTMANFYNVIKPWRDNVVDAVYTTVE